MIRIIKIIIVITAIIFQASCHEPELQQEPGGGPLVNTSHLDALYEEINTEGNPMGIIHIYSDYPDYKWQGDDDEGIACIDDAARAAIFYLRNYQLKSDTASLVKSGKLIEFLLFMQSENGFFYNFIFADHSINKTHKNSIAEPNWWSWRAMWALSEGYKIFENSDKETAGKILSALEKAVDASRKTFSLKKSFKKINGIKFPDWLPYHNAGDQASVLIPALLNYYEETRDSSIIGLINNLCDGILLMQKGDSANIPFFAFLSWQNVWHAYGNSQSYALLKASEILKRNEFRAAGLNEINFFYEYLLKQNFLSSFEIRRDNDLFTFSEEKRFPQIAYNFRPMISACLEAFTLCSDSVYLEKALAISEWFYGWNAAGRQMYDTKNGRCFDGINSENDVNLNSGAESTIEALLSMQLLEKYGISEKDFNKIILKNKK